MKDFANIKTGRIVQGPVAYQTVQAKIDGHLRRILLGTGSGNSYISRKLGRRLTTKPCRNLNLYVLSSVPNIHPKEQRKKFPHLKGIWFSDVSTKENLPIHAILGVKDFANIKIGRIVQGQKGEPIAEKTTLGWTLMRVIQQIDHDSMRSPSHLMVESISTVNQDYKTLWDLDVLEVTDRNDTVYEEFRDNIAKKQDGRYSVRLPWRKGNYFLPDNRQLSENRLRSQFKKLKKTPGILEAYDKVICQQIEENIVEPVPSEPDGKRIHYLPHHPVIRTEAETTKLKIVYDASAKDRKFNRSLNDCLHTGPALQPMLYDILVKFRM